MNFSDSEWRELRKNGITIDGYEVVKIANGLFKLEGKSPMGADGVRAFFQLENKIEILKSKKNKLEAYLQ